MFETIFLHTSFWVRDFWAFLTSFVVVMSFMPMTIRYLQKQQMKQVIRTLGPETHFSKKGTPTLGGIVILAALGVSMALWCDWRCVDVILCAIALLGYGVIGWCDDYLKVVRKNTDGLKSRWKFFWQSCLAIALVLLAFHGFSSVQHVFWIPGWKSVLGHVDHIAWLICIIGYFMISGYSNAVNLTDGLDSLAILLIISVALGVGVLATLTAQPQWAQDFSLIWIPQATEIAVICAALIGAGLGFLWFNAFPAQVFMGDVGSLSIGALFGLMAFILRQEIVMLIMGGIFVLETVSVMLQVGSYRLRKKRIFKMAPIHHHFELMGWPETRVVARFWIMTVILVLFALSLVL